MDRTPTSQTSTELIDEHMNAHLDERASELMWVTLDQLKFKAIIGIFPHERLTPQPLRVALEMGISPEAWVIAATRGALEQSVDYSVVSRVIRELATAGQFRLIESLVYLIAVTLLRAPETYEGRCLIERVRVTVHKPEALAESGGGEPAVRLALDRTSDLVTHLFRDSLSDSTAQRDQLTDLLERLSHPARLSLLMELPEVQIVYVACSAPDQVELSSQETLVSLGAPLKTESVEPTEIIEIIETIETIERTECAERSGSVGPEIESKRRVSWDREAALLYIKRRSPLESPTS